MRKLLDVLLGTSQENAIKTGKLKPKAAKSANATSTAAAAPALAAAPATAPAVPTAAAPAKA